MTDPVADMLTRIRNGLVAKHDKTVVPASKLKLAVAKILKDEGYIEDFVKHDTGPQGEITIVLKYGEGGEPAIRYLQRASRPGRRHYVKKDAVPRVLAGLGVAILSTSQGVMSGRDARAKGVGGEVLCTVY